MTLDAILGSRNRVRVLRALFAHGDGLSGRGVSTAAGVSPSAGKASLGELVRFGVVLHTPGRGKSTYEINHSHRLVPDLQRLFRAELRLPGRVADNVFRCLRRSPFRVGGLGISSDGAVSVALTPCPEPDTAEILEIARTLQYEFGLGPLRTVKDASFIPAAERIPYPPPVETARGTLGHGAVLRFFGISDPSPPQRPVEP